MSKVNIKDTRVTSRAILLKNSGTCRSGVFIVKVFEQVNVCWVDPEAVVI